MVDRLPNWSSHFTIRDPLSNLIFHISLSQRHYHARPVELICLFCKLQMFYRSSVVLHCFFALVKFCLFKLNYNFPGFWGLTHGIEFELLIPGLPF